MNKLVMALYTAATAFALAAPPADAGRRVKARGAVANPAGGVTGGRIAGAHGPNGGA